LILININIIESKGVIILRFTDNSILARNIEEIQPNFVKSKQVILNRFMYFHYSHWDSIKDILWLNDDPKTFITTSDDQSLMIWTYRGDKWTNSYFDLLKTIDKNLNNFSFISNDKKIKSLLENKKSQSQQKSYYSSNNERDETDSNFSQQKYFINCLALHPKFQNTFIGGDNKGNLFIFDIKLQKTVKKVVIGNFPINMLNFSQNGTYLSIGFETGLVILSDYSNDFKFCTKLEDHFIDLTNTNSRKNTNYFLSCNNILLYLYY